MKVMTPPIKSQGIKTKLIPWIENAIPKGFSGRWIEPFMGTAVVGLNLAPDKGVLSDINPHLVNFYNALAENVISPRVVKDYLEREGESLLKTGEAHYYFIRDRFNELGDPLDFLFVNRAGFNGMIRFNRKGGFNIPFCRKPNRFAQAYVTKITNQVRWAQKVIQNKNLKFQFEDFRTAIQNAEEGDLIYCDPPYIGRHVDYFSGWSEESEFDLATELAKSKAMFILSSWHHNDFRKNEYMETLWSKFHISTQEHFYHVGGKEANRNPVVEALVTNFEISQFVQRQKTEQMELL